MVTSTSSPWTSKTRRLILCCTALAAGGWGGPVSAQGTEAPSIKVGEPEGFANLTEEQMLLVDVYFGGVRQGETTIKTAPGVVTFVDPAEALALLPPLNDPAVVEGALTSANLPSNANLACGKTSDPAQCGRLAPEVAGVIFDRDNFRLEIFVNPVFLEVQGDLQERYLPTPDKSLAVINSVGGIVAGALGTSSSSYTFQDSLLVGNGERRLRAEVSYSSGVGFEAERLSAEWDRPEIRYSAGWLWTPGTDLAGRRKVLGFGLETQIDTRLDKDEIQGSPLVVYLDRRARVEVLREGRVLHSAIYEAGNQQIDTSSMPDGSYNVTLHIAEPGSSAREETRFFSKSRLIPSLGRTNFFAYGGLLVDGYSRGSLDPSGDPYFQGGVVHRLSQSLAFGGTVAASDESGSAEVGATLFTSLANIRAAAVVDLEGAYGGILQVASSGSSRLNFNFDLRHIEGEGFDAVAQPQVGREFTSRFGSPSTFLPQGTYSQIGGVVSYSIANLRLLGTLFFRDDEADEARYSIGPSLEWDVLRAGRLTVTLRSDLTATDRGEAGFAGVAVRLLGVGNQVTAMGGVRKSSMPDDMLGEGAVAALSGAWSPKLAGGDLALGAGLEHQPNQDSYIASADFRHALGSMAGDLSHAIGPASDVTQYSLGFQTSFAAGSGALEIAGRTSTESLIVAKVDGARPHDSFEVLVNEQLAGKIEGTSALSLPLPAYRAYEVRIRPTGPDLLSYDSSPRSVGLYPGTVAKLEWTASPVSVKFGRLVDPDGQPIAGATITGKGAWSETDENGNFQLEVADDAELTVSTGQGPSFELVLPPSPAGAGSIARIGTVECCGRADVMLSELRPMGKTK